MGWWASKMAQWVEVPLKILTDNWTSIPVAHMQKERADSCMLSFDCHMYCGTCAPIHIPTRYTKLIRLKKKRQEANPYPVDFQRNLG